MKRLKKKVEEKREFLIPEYSLAPKTKKLIKIPKPVLWVLSINLLLGITIYLPPALIPEQNPHLLESSILLPDESALLLSTAYLKDHPDEDFDDDGLSNAQEQSLGTSPYRIDTDDDGVTDFAELYMTNTNPTIHDDAIVEYIKALDAETGNIVNTPYKINGVILWARDYEARARGSVVQTLNGYRFCNFTGLAQFPDETIAYRYWNGRHIPMQQNRQGLYSIDGDWEVRLYEEALTVIHVLRVFGHEFYIEDNLIGKTLSFLLPGYGQGLITCRVGAVTDLYDQIVYYENEIHDFSDAMVLDDSRFGRNEVLLTDIGRVRQCITDGIPVVVSLFSHQAGEILVQAYGYTNENHLLLASLDGIPVGAMNIQEQAKRLIDESGLQQYEYFHFDACGFDSRAFHRISFIILD